MMSPFDISYANTHLQAYNNMLPYCKASSWTRENSFLYVEMLVSESEAVLDQDFMAARRLSPYVEEFIPYNNYANPSAYQEYMDWYRVTKARTLSNRGATSQYSQNPSHEFCTSFDRDSTYSTNMDEEGSLAESEEVNSVVESLFTQSSKGSGILKEGSAEERRLEQRQKQIDYGKVLI